MRRLSLFFMFILFGCNQTPQLNQNIEAQIHLIDRFADFAFAKSDSQRFIISYVPLIEDGKLRKYTLEILNDTPLPELKKHEKLNTALLKNLTTPNKLEPEELSKSRHLIVSNKESLDSAIKYTNLTYVGELSVSEVSIDEKSLIYIEAVSPDHYKGLTRFILLERENNQWVIVDNFPGIELSTDSTDFPLID